jgi:hypothetical protein
MDRLKLIGIIQNHKIFCFGMKWFGHPKTISDQLCEYVWLHFQKPEN